MNNKLKIYVFPDSGLFVSKLNLDILTSKWIYGYISKHHLVRSLQSNMLLEYKTET